MTLGLALDYEARHIESLGFTKAKTLDMGWGGG